MAAEKPLEILRTFRELKIKGGTKMIRSKHWWLVAFVIFLSGCSSLGPRIISANHRSVSVEILPIHSERDALRVADEHCKKFGRSAVLVQDRHGGKFNYQCVK